MFSLPAPNDWGIELAKFAMNETKRECCHPGGKKKKWHALGRRWEDKRSTTACLPDGNKCVARAECISKLIQIDKHTQ